jgi:hypothetical protein
MVGSSLTGKLNRWSLTLRCFGVVGMIRRLFTDKLIYRLLGIAGSWSLVSATPVTPAYPVHTSGSPLALNIVNNCRNIVQMGSCKFEIRSLKALYIFRV